MVIATLSFNSPPGMVGVVTHPVYQAITRCVNACATAVGEPRFWQNIHAASVLLWLALCIPGLLWWSESIKFVVFASLWANVVGHASSWQAARAERRIDPDDPL